MTWNSVLLLSSFALMAGSTTSAFVPRIHRGNNTSIAVHPHQVSLRLYKQHFCGATIISDRLILTAAHCITDPDIAPYFDQVTVHTGTSSVRENGDVHSVASTVAHPGFGSIGNFMLNDIGILKLKTPIKFGKNQKAIKLPSKAPTNGEAAVITGWGRNEKNKRSVTLQQLYVTMHTGKDCQDSLLETISKTQMCADRAVGRGACHGDSGGPLLAGGELVGVGSSIGADDCGSKYPDLYEIVYDHLDFINFHLNSTV